jgi:hypothetical protein
MARFATTWRSVRNGSQGVFFRSQKTLFSGADQAIAGRPDDRRAMVPTLVARLGQVPFSVPTFAHSTLSVYIF